MADFSRGRARQPKPTYQQSRQFQDRRAPGAADKRRAQRRDSPRHKQRAAAARGPRPRAPHHARSAHGPDPRALAFAVLRHAKPGELLEPLVLEELRRGNLDPSMAHRVIPMLEDAARFAMLFDHLISHVATRPASELDTDVRAALHLYLSWFLLDDPQAVYAHGQAAVDLLGPRHNARGFVNACARRLSELLAVGQTPAENFRGLAAAGSQPEFWRDRCRLGNGRMLRAPRAIFADYASDPAAHLAQTCALPLDFVKRLGDQHGPSAAALIALASIERPPTWLRPNTLKISAAGLKHTLSLRGVEAIEHAGAVALPRGTRDFDSLGVFETGLAYAQDFSAQQVSPALHARPGEAILDLCAAPGGKSGHLAEITGDRARILAVDASLEKVGRIQENIARMGYASIATAAADAAEVRFPQPFDRVLLDAPCSNSGVLYRRAEARHRLSADKLAELTALQQRLLANAAANLRAGGVLVYSVCSVLFEEGVDVTRAFLAQGREAAGWVIEEENILLPVPSWHDGAYFCHLKAPAG